MLRVDGEGGVQGWEVHGWDMQCGGMPSRGMQCRGVPSWEVQGREVQGWEERLRSRAGWCR
jgi:hypothetical protein